MGVYSQNRTKSLVAESVVNEHDAIVKSIEECEVDPRFCNLMETVIQLHENDKKVFDAMIECDFISVTNEAVMLEDEAATANGEANETKKVKLKEKIEQIFTAVIEALKKFAANAIVKITDLVKSDAKLYNGYKYILKAANLEGFGGIKDFAFPNAQINSDSIATAQRAYSITNDLFATIKGAQEKEPIDTAYEAFTAKIEEEAKKFEGLAADKTLFHDKVDSFIPNDAQLKRSLEEVVSAKATIAGIKAATANTIESLKKLQKEAKADYKDAKKNKAEELDVYKLNKKYTASSAVCKLYQKGLNIYLNVAAKQLAAFRKVVILCGRYAAKKVKGEQPEKEVSAQGEAAIQFALGESSDLYVAECLGY